MRNTKILQLLQALPEKQVKQLSRALRKGHANNSIPAILLNYFVGLYPFDQSEEEREAIRLKKQVDPLGKDFVIREVLHSDVKASTRVRVSKELYKLYEEAIKYFLDIHLQEKKILKAELELEVLRKLKMDELFYAQAGDLRKELLKLPDCADKYIRLAHLENSVYHYCPTEKITDDLTELTQYNRYLEAYYRIGKWKYLGEVTNRKNILNKDLFTEQAFTTVTDQSDFSSPKGYGLLKELYQGIYQLSLRVNPDSYHVMKKLLWEHYPDFIEEDRLILLSHLINYASKNINRGIENSTVEIYELYRFGAEHRILLESNFIVVDNFRNAVSVACAMKDFTWAKQFIEEYEIHLPESTRKSVKALAVARIDFGEENYLKVLDLEHPDYEQKGAGNKLIARLLLVQSYYELGVDYKPTLISKIKSFESFSNRKNMYHEDSITSIINFLRLLKVIIRENNRPSKNVIFEQMDSYALIANRPWIANKIAALPE